MMFVRVVMYQFKHDINKMKNMAKAKEMFEALPSSIEWIVSMEVGLDINRGKNAYDLCVHVTFKTRDDMTWFYSEPSHIEVENFLKEVTTSSHIVDYVYEEDTCSVQIQLFLFYV